MHYVYFIFFEFICIIFIILFHVNILVVSFRKIWYSVFWVCKTHLTAESLGDFIAKCTEYTKFGVELGQSLNTIFSAHETHHFLQYQ